MSTSKDIAWLRDTLKKGWHATVAFDGNVDENTDWISLLLNKIDELEKENLSYYNRSCDSCRHEDGDNSSAFCGYCMRADSWLKDNWEAK